MATAAVRSQLRELAEEVVAAAPGDGEARRGAAADVAREAMQRSAADPEELEALVVMLGIRHVIAAGREVRPPAGDLHVEPQVLVSLAADPESVSGADGDEARAHVEACPRCAEDLGLARRMLRLASGPRPVAPSAPSAGAAAPPDPTEVPDPTAAPDPTALPEPAALATPVSVTPAPSAAGPAVEAPPRAGSPSGSTSSGAPQAPAPSAARRGGEPRTTPPPTTPPPTTPPPTGGPIRPPRGGRLDPKGTVSWWKAMWPVAAILAVGVALWVVRHGSAGASADEVVAVAAIADRTAPTAPDAGDLPWEAEGAVHDLGNGDCESAALRFETAARQVPDEPALRFWSAACWVCAGDGDRALSALDAYEAAVGPSGSADVLWLRSQGLLLRGEHQEARRLLVQLRGIDLDRARAIDAQLNALAAL